MRDYRALRGRIVEMYGNLTGFCKETGENYQQLSHKLANGEPISTRKIISLANALNIPESEIGVYFFKENVLKDETNDDSEFRTA